MLPTGLRLDHWLTGASTYQKPACEHSYGWREELRWNAQTGRLEPLEPSPPPGADPRSVMRERVARVRSRLTSLRTEDLAGWDDAASGIMEVLPAHALLENKALWSLRAVAGRRLEKPLVPPEAEESVCQRGTTKAHPEPEPLLREFLRRAGKGEFLEHSEWFDAAVTCPGTEPGPDEFTLISDARLNELLVCGASAVARVDYDVLGHVGYGHRLVPQRRTVPRSIELRRTEQGWRIESSAIGLGQHLLESAWHGEPPAQKQGR